MYTFLTCTTTEQENTHARSIVSNAHELAPGLQ